MTSDNDTGRTKQRIRAVTCPGGARWPEVNARIPNRFHLLSYHVRKLSGTGRFRDETLEREPTIPKCPRGL